MRRFDSDPRLQFKSLRFPKNFAGFWPQKPPDQYRIQYHKQNRRVSPGICRSPGSIGLLTPPNRFPLSSLGGVMKNRYRIVRYRRYGGMYYIHDTETDLRWSLRTKDKARATCCRKERGRPRAGIQLAEVPGQHGCFRSGSGDSHLGRRPYHPDHEQTRRKREPRLAGQVFDRKGS